jgi:carbamate kinase
MRLVIALGGNAMTSPDGSARPDDQRRAIEAAAEPMADLAASGHELFVTHGNGPQVGNLLVKNEIAASVVPPVPLDWCGAQTQATIGVLLMNALDRALAARGSAVSTVALVSRTVVDAGDAGFANPSKPIGRYLPMNEAAVMIDHGQVWQDCGDRGWRRMVASPEPLDCLDVAAAVALVHAGFVVVCSGGGGVPVVERDGGSWVGVEAVIDKDLTAAVLAQRVMADGLVIATDVDGVYLNWPSAGATPISAVSVGQLRAWAQDGRFAVGSMGPKVEAACRFAERTGNTAVITSLSLLGSALSGDAGTRVFRD